MLQGLDRRGFLRAGALGLVAGGGLASGALARPPRALVRPQGRARNVIFMVSDGMSTGTLTLAEQVTRVRHARSTNWVSLWNEPGVRRASATTHCANSLVTDSAAGGSAWGIGTKVPFNSVNIPADGVPRTPILVHAREQGKATGLVTTTRVTHATPASFIANVPDRNMEDEIARQIIARGFDVALGGGAKHFPQSLLQSAKDVRVVTDAQALAGVRSNPGTPVLGLFAPSHCPHELDRPETAPALQGMTRAALALLKDKSNGFVMQIEGGRVDHGAHANDAGSLLAEQLAFDECIGIVREFAKDRDDTLVIITSDHGNANPGLTLYGKDAARGLELAASAKHSFEWIFRSLGTKLAFDDPDDFSKIGDLEPLLGLVKEATGAELTREQFEVLTSAIHGQARHPFRTQAAKATSVLGALLSNFNAIGFVSPNHTSDVVEVTAWGPGAEFVRPFIDNTDLHEVVVRALDLAPAKAG